MLAHSVRSAFFAGTCLSIFVLSTVPGAKSQEAMLWHEPAPTREIAQNYGRGFATGDSETRFEVAQADEAGMLLRIDRLENQLRQLTGQIEQMQFTTRKLEDQLKKFQEDVEFRFQETRGQTGSGQGSAPPAPPGKSLQRRSETEDSPPTGGTAALLDPAEPEPFASPRNRMRRSDAFDPDRDPTAPGAPRPLGSPATTQPSAAITRMQRSSASAFDDRDPEAPLDLSGSKLGGSNLPATSERANTLSARTAAAGQSGLGVGSGTDTAVAQARSPTDPAKDDYDRALGQLNQKEYESAEKSFTAFLQKNPKSKLTSDALFYLGESYFQRGRQREAAEQYLKVSTTYAGSQRAPNAFLRLGQALNALGAKEQACAAYAEIGRKYPNASASVRADAEREAKRARC
jgi:tol-pal system protein YbgF